MSSPFDDLRTEIATLRDQIAEQTAAVQTLVRRHRAIEAIGTTDAVDRDVLATAWALAHNERVSLPDALRFVVAGHFRHIERCMAGNASYLHPDPEVFA